MVQPAHRDDRATLYRRKDPARRRENHRLAEGRQHRIAGDRRHRDECVPEQQCRRAAGILPQIAIEEVYGVHRQGVSRYARLQRHRDLVDLPRG